jgi:hypothetical protein
MALAAYAGGTRLLHYLIILQAFAAFLEERGRSE